MQGPNEFVVTGTFKNWERWADFLDTYADFSDGRSIR